MRSEKQGEVDLPSKRQVGMGGGEPGMGGIERNGPEREIEGVRRM